MDRGKGPLSVSLSHPETTFILNPFSCGLTTPHEPLAASNDDDSMILKFLIFMIWKFVIDDIPVPADLDQGPKAKRIYFSPPTLSVANSIETTHYLSSSVISAKNHHDFSCRVLRTRASMQYGPASICSHPSQGSVVHARKNLLSDGRRDNVTDCQHGIHAFGTPTWGECRNRLSFSVFIGASFLTLTIQRRSLLFFLLQSSMCCS